MNYLAHALLSPPDNLVFLGNFCGDFVKGSQNPSLSEKVWLGVQLHRFIDSYTDSHPIVHQSKQRISKERRRFAGIIVDVAHDYFLSQNWGLYSQQERIPFIDSVYSHLETYTHELPPQFHEVKERIIQYDWLNGYHSLEGINQTLESIGRRFQKRTNRPNTITGSIAEIHQHIEDLEQDFLLFFPELQREASQWIEMNLIKK